MAESRIQVTLEPVTIFRAVEGDEIEGWGLYRQGSLLLGCDSREEALARAEQFGFEIVGADVEPTGPGHWVSASCRGERCSVCGKEATHKVGEEIMSDDPMAHVPRHNMTAYICCDHFSAIMRSECRRG